MLGSRKASDEILKILLLAETQREPKEIRRSKDKTLSLAKPQRRKEKKDNNRREPQTLFLAKPARAAKETVNIKNQKSGLMVGSFKTQRK
jgi:hypothetical protein